MPYNSLISRTDAAALIPEETANLITQNLARESAAMALMRRITMPNRTLTFPVLSALPLAYFVSGDTGLKQTTEVAWSNKQIVVEELAAIVPIPEAVVEDLEDSGFDLWGEVQPLVESAIADTLDAAIFFGTNKPASWPTDVVAAAVAAAGNSVARGTSTDAEGAFAGDMDLLIAAVEEDGYDVNGFVANRAIRRYLRGARDTTGQRLLEVNGQVDSYDGIPIEYPMRGMWPTGLSAAEVIGGDWSQFVIGVRKDFTWKLMTEGVITDNSVPPQIIYNLPQQDMVAMRVVFRVGWQIANPMNRDNPNDATRYPVAVLRSPAA